MYFAIIKKLLQSILSSYEIIFFVSARRLLFQNRRTHFEVQVGKMGKHFANETDVLEAATYQELQFGRK